MKSIYKTFGVTVALVVICARFAFAYPSWYDPEKGIGFKPDVPDFYQHQSFTTDPNDPEYYKWERRWDEEKAEWVVGGWCWPTALVNSLYWWDTNGYDRNTPNDLFYDTPGDWIEDMKTNIKKTAEDMFTDGKSMTQILNDRKHPPEKLPLYVTRYEYKWDATTEKWKVKSSTEDGTYWGETKYESMFDLYKDELLRCEDILIRLIDSDPAAPNWWWSGSYHMLTGVGIEFKTCQETEGKIWFADPNDTYKEPHDTDNGWNDPYIIGDELPFGQKYYDWAKIGEDGTILDGYYKGAKISWIYAISPVPEPSTLLLLGSGLAGIIGFGRKRYLRRRGKF